MWDCTLHGIVDVFKTICTQFSFGRSSWCVPSEKFRRHFRLRNAHVFSWLYRSYITVLFELFSIFCYIQMYYLEHQAHLDGIIFWKLVIDVSFFESILDTTSHNCSVLLINDFWQYLFHFLLSPYPHFLRQILSPGYSSISSSLFIHQKCFYFLISSICLDNLVYIFYIDYI